MRVCGVNFRSPAALNKAAATRGFAKGVSRAVSPRFFFFSENETEKTEETEKRKTTEKNGKKRKKTEENGKNQKRHRSGDPFCETPNNSLK